MGKPRPKRIPSDDCAVWIDGEECRPHEGEWVEMVCAETVGELRARVGFEQLSVRIDAAKGEPDEGRQINAIMDAHYGEMCDYLSRRVFAWSWTDDWGQALPQPDGTPGPLLRLRAGELYWLLNATFQRETAAERKNA